VNVLGPPVWPAVGGTAGVVLFELELMLPLAPVADAPDAVPVAEAETLLMIERASEGLMVVVIWEERAEDVPEELEPLLEEFDPLLEEFDPLLEEPLLEEFDPLLELELPEELEELNPETVLAIIPIISGAVSMKAMVGPATCWVVARMTTEFWRGWASDVIQMATAPLMPDGTTHWSMGKARENSAPPTII
jgi:hypothetical protein